VAHAIHAITTLAVGYQGVADGLNDKLRAREAAARERRPLGESFFAGVWGRAVQVE
jgi:hypothetical protein